MNNLDPIATQLPGEPRLPLMGRDTLAPGFCRLYALVREGNYERAEKMLLAIISTAKSRTSNPEKDKQHAWSARNIADQMEMWFREYMKGEGPENRINVVKTDDELVFTVQPTLSEIKSARPPAEPEEAQ